MTPPPGAPSVSSLLEALLAEGSGVRRFLDRLPDVDPGARGSSGDAVRFVRQLAAPDRPLHTGPVEAKRRADVERAVGILVATTGASVPSAEAALRERAVMLDLDVAQVALAIVTAAGDPRTR